MRNLFNMILINTFWIRQYPYNSLTFARHNILEMILCKNYARYFCVIPGLSALFPRLGDFPETLLSLSGLNILSSLPLFLLSLPPNLYLSFYLSLSLLYIILFGVSNGRFRPCFISELIIFVLLF